MAEFQVYVFISYSVYFTEKQIVFKFDSGLKV